MAIYHFTLRMVQRSSGQSIVAIAADRARVVLQDHRLDQQTEQDGLVSGCTNATEMELAISVRAV